MNGKRNVFDPVISQLERFAKPPITPFTVAGTLCTI